MTVLYLSITIVCFTWERLLDWLNLRSVATAGDRIPADLRPRFDQPQLARISDYLGTHAWFGAVEAAYAILLACFFLFSGVLTLSERLIHLAPLPALLSGACLFLAFGLLNELSVLPFAWYETFRLETRFSFNRTTSGTFWSDRLKSFVLKGFLGGTCMVVILWLIRVCGSSWWLPVTVTVILFQLLVVVLFPRVIASWFNRFTPLPPGELRTRLEMLARQSGFPIQDIAVMDESRRSTHANAYLAGFGRHKRLVLFDTLIHQLNTEEIAAALAHEIGHFRRRHLLKLILLLAGLSALLCYWGSRVLTWTAFQNAFGLPAEPTARGLLILVLFGEPFVVWFRPIVHCLQRHCEYQADADAAVLAGGPESLASALARLAEQNLTNPAPHPLYSWFHHSHPTLSERVAALRRLSISNKGLRPTPNTVSPIMIAILVSGVFSMAQPAPHQEVRFPARPRFSEAAGLDAGTTSADTRQQVIRNGTELLSEPLEIPNQEGQWIFYYQCAKDSTRLQPENALVHVCPTCRTKYTDDRTIAAYRTLLFTHADQACETLGLAYAASGEERFVVPVKAALLTLARVYPTFHRHDRWGRTGLLAVVGGRRYCQLLDEATSVVKLAKAYDAIAKSAMLSAEDRKVIEELLLSIAREVRTYQLFIRSRNNHQTWFNAAYVAVGLATGDDELVEAGITGSRGLLWQLQNSVTSDGFWYEGTVSYHFYALSAIMETVEAAERCGFRIPDAPLKALFLAPLQIAYPDGRVPAFHDGDRASLTAWHGAYRWAANRFPDPVFAEFAEKDTGGPAIPARSALLAGIGLTVLRAGSGPQAVCAMADFGPHGDHHGHPDKLNLVLYALGRELVVDPGRISYSVPQYETWCRTSVAHNTVVLNEGNQKPVTGRQLYFQTTPDFSACLMDAGPAYPGYALRRFLVLCPPVLIDAFMVQGKTATTIDWVTHVRGLFKPQNLGMTRLGKALAERNGYQHLRDVRQAAGAEVAEFAWEQPSGQVLRIFCLGDGSSTFYAGLGIGTDLKEEVPFLIRRRTAESTLFLTVYDLSGKPETGIAGIARLTPTDPSDAVCGVRISFRGRQELRAWLDLREKAEPEPLAGGGTFTRFRLDQSAP